VPRYFEHPSNGTWTVLVAPFDPRNPLNIASMRQPATTAKLPELPVELIFNPSGYHNNVIRPLTIIVA
jgi:hypothetical protein